MSLPPCIFGHKSQFPEEPCCLAGMKTTSGLSSQYLVYFPLGFRSTSESEIPQIITAAQQSIVLPQAFSVCLLMSTSVDITREPQHRALFSLPL